MARESRSWEAMQASYSGSRLSSTPGVVRPAVEVVVAEHWSTSSLHRSSAPVRRANFSASMRTCSELPA